MEILTDKRAIPPGWEGAVGSVRRELFLPDTIEVHGRAVSRSCHPEQWLDHVYGDLPLTTQVNDGNGTPEGGYRLPTSSSSMPSVMLQMLGLLRAEPGHTVLEAGAGTGYNAAWLAHRLGGDRVTSVDIDPGLVERAVRNVTAAGYTPRIVHGDADQGWPPGAPYDRLIATYAVPVSPYAWVEQVPRGRIVAPWGGSFFPHSFVTVQTEGGVGRGRFSGFPSFMRTRNDRPHRGYLADFLHHTDQVDVGRTALNPLDVVGDADALFFIGLALPTVWHLLVEAGDGSGESTWWLLADDRASWASADYVPGQDDYAVEQYGSRRLWDELETAYRAWERLERPERGRAGLTVDCEGQRVWLDSEEHVIA
ncbi:methyltransferase domain-containing protein [Streptomyces sp. NPDC004838]